MSAESSVNRIETYYAREGSDAQGRPKTPSDPNWKMYSSVVTTTEPAPEKEFGVRRGLGHDAPQDKSQAQETHELTVEYELERFPETSDGSPNDPVADAALRSVDNDLKNTHSFLQVTERSGILARNTVHEKWFSRSDVDGSSHPGSSVPDATSRDSRQYIYGRGGIPEEAVLGIDASDSALCVVECTYQFQKVRPYQFDQPENGSLHVQSTSAADTGITVHLETAGTDRTVATATLEGTTVKSPTGTFDSLGSVWVDGDHSGSILVYDDDGSGSAEQLLAVIKGSDRYSGIESDRGVPTLGTNGSFDSGDDLKKQYAIGAEVTWNGRAIADYHQGSSLTISNDIGEEAATDTGLAMARQVGTQEITCETTAFGETASTDNFSDFVEGREGEYSIQLTDGDITLPKAFLSEGAPAASESGEAFLLPEATFMALEDVDNSREAIEFTPASS